MQVDVKYKVLHALAKCDLTIAELKALYIDKYDGLKIAQMTREGLTEWIRPPENPHSAATGIRITAAGRIAAQITAKHP